MTVIGLIKIDSNDRDEELIQIFDSAHGHGPPVAKCLGECSVVADIDKLRADLRSELRLFRSRVPQRVLQSRPLDQ